jgi:hypothetical protein
MPVRRNPLGLNALQLKTLALLQELARLPDVARETDEGIEVTAFPRPHGDHFHLGPYVVMARDATGFSNPAPWAALERKGLVRSMFPDGALLLPAGRDYDTGVRDEILHASGH